MKKVEKYCYFWKQIKKKGFYLFDVDNDEWEIINVLQKPFRLVYNDESYSLKNFLSFYIKNAAPFAKLLDIIDNSYIKSLCKKIVTTKYSEYSNKPLQRTGNTARR